MERADYLANPKLQAKLVLVVLLTINAFVLHRLTFPRLARGRRVARWHASDWLIVGVPVAVSNFLWMFVAFLGVARAWNGTMPFGEIMAIAAVLYGVAQAAVLAILALAASDADPKTHPRSARVRRWLASLGNLGRLAVIDEESPPFRLAGDAAVAAPTMIAARRCRRRQAHCAGTCAEKAQRTRGWRPVTGYCGSV